MSDNFQNKNGQDENQNTTQNQKVKLRLRLKSGEEFEAEGSLSFVLTQKEEFLNKNTPPAQDGTPYTKTAYTAEISEQNTNTATPQNIQKQNAARQYNLNIPAIIRRKQEEEKAVITESRTAPQPIQNTQDFTQKEGENTWQIDEKIWSKVAYLDGADIILRRKIKDLKPGIAALITLAAAKMLAGIQKMSALELVKSLKLSGYFKSGDRLDRILLPEIKAGTIFFIGTKRKREYIISQTGTAKAYTSAEHLMI